jgi:hypothetical protein
MAEVTCSGVDGRRSSSIVSACYHHHHLLNCSSTRPVYNPAENKTPFFENKAVRGETGALLICCRGPQACRCLYTVYEVCYSRTGRSLRNRNRYKIKSIGWSRASNSLLFYGHASPSLSVHGILKSYRCYWGTLLTSPQQVKYKMKYQNLFIFYVL